MGSGTGQGVPVYIVGYNNGKPVYSSEGSHLQISSTYDKIKNLGRFQVRTTEKGGLILPDCSCGSVVIRAKAGNLDDIWIGGIAEDRPEVNIGMPLHEDESIILYVDNTNKVRMVAASDYDEVYVYAYLDRTEDVIITPGNPPPPDLTPPTVVSVFPTDGSNPVEVNTAIYAIFDEELDNNSINTTNITVSPAISYTVTKDSVDPTKVLIKPDANLAFSTAYTVTLTTGLTDDAEDLNALAAPFDWSFTTAAAPPPPDTTPPTIVSVTPANAATGIGININPVVSFSEAILAASITASTVKLTKVSNNQGLSININQSTDEKTITIVPESTLEFSTEYRLDIVGGASGIKDQADTPNPLATSASYTFSTEAQAISATYSVSGNTYQLLHTFAYHKVGAFVNSSSSILRNGKPFTKFVFNLRKKGNPSGTIRFDITNSTGSVKRALGTINITSLSTTSDTAITKEITGYTFSTGDLVLVHYEGGDKDNGLNVRISDTNATSDGSATCLRRYYGFVWNVWGTDSSSDLSGLMYS